MYSFNQAVGIVLCDARYSARCRQQNDIRARCNEGLGIGGGHDFLPALPCYAGGMHLSGGQHNAVTDSGRNLLQRCYDQFVADAVAGVAGKHDQINAHISGAARVFYRSQAAAAHLPQRTIVAFCRFGVAWLQIDADDTACQTLELPHGLCLGNLRQGVDDRMLHIKHVQQQNVCAQGSCVFGVCHIDQQRRCQTDGLTGQHTPLAAGNGVQQVSLAVGG